MNAFTISGLSSIFLNSLYPPSCLLCNQDIAKSGALCSSCWADIDFIAGKQCFRCGNPVAYALRDENDEDIICRNCVWKPPKWRRGGAAIIYQGAGKRLVHDIKYRDRHELSAMLARWIWQHSRTLMERSDYIIPVPLHWFRKQRRKANQSALLARSLCQIAGRSYSFLPEALVRHRWTPPQLGRSFSERQSNVRGAFRVPYRFRKRLQGAAVLLVDDVLTTGATMNACALTLINAGVAEINIAVLARVSQKASAGY